MPVDLSEQTDLIYAAFIKLGLTQTLQCFHTLFSDNTPDGDSGPTGHRAWRRDINNLSVFVSVPPF